jgi:diacylglycerol O-acyltransferase / wax synthase
MPVFDRQMSDAEGLMWRLEKDPYLASSFATVAILDRPIDHDRLVERMERASIAVPRLRQRVQPVPVHLSAPIWVDDPDFDIRYHVRRISLPKPGDVGTLTELAALIAADPFDRTRPLWQFWVVDGLRGGRGALVYKMHHTIADGEGSLAVSMQFLDLERDAPHPPVPERDTESDTAEAQPTTVELVRDLVAGSLRLPIGLLRQTRDLLADPANLPGSGAAITETVRALVSEMSDVDGARSPLWTRRSLRRRVELVRLPLGATKTAAKKLGGSLNAAFVTVAAHAAGRYHDELGAPVESLRASMAVSTRQDGSGSNAFGLVRMLVPTAEMPIGERFAAVCEATASAVTSSSSGALDAVAALSASLPTALLTRVARMQSQTVDFATSNVRGSPVPLYIAGAQVRASHPIGPLGGVACNVTVLSYLDHLDIGLHIDVAAIDEPDRLRTAFETASRQFVAAARRRP